MENNLGTGGIGSVEKSPEELDFERMFEVAKGMPLVANGAFIESEEELEAENKNSLYGAYWESGDPPKMAMYKIIDSAGKLSTLMLVLKTLESWDNNQEKKGLVERATTFLKGWKKSWEKDKIKFTSELEPILSELGIEIPQTADEARMLKENIINFENFKKLGEKYKEELA